VFEFPSDFGRYRLTGIAGEGGMATVYRAVLPGPMGFEKRLVVKVIRPALVEDEEFLRALVTEALLGCQLHHPNIVEVYEFNQTNGRYYLAMELVDGISLSYLVRRHRKVGHAVPTPVTLHVMGQILDGLEYAHGAKDEDGSALNVIHRDLKPSNIAVTPDGMVKLLDFGIAQVTMARAGMQTSGAIRGTPRYMSPEQIETPMDITPASDVFSLAAVLYELVTVRSLFAPRPGQEPIDLVVHMPLDEQIAEVEYRIPGMGDVFRTMVARDVRQRYLSAAQVNYALRPLHEKYGDSDAARQYLADLVTEYREENQAEELVPEYFEPGYATGWEPWVGDGDKKDSAPATAVLGEASGAAANYPTASGDSLATIPLPPRPEAPISGRRQALGPAATATPSTATSLAGSRIQARRDEDTPSVITPPTVEVRETGAHWGIVAALAVPLVLILIGVVAFGMIKVFGVQPPGPRLGDDKDIIFVEDVGEEPTPVEIVQVHEPRTPEPYTSEPVTPEPVTAEPATPEQVVEVVEPATPPPPPPPSGFGKIRIDADPWAQVWIDGEAHGETPIQATVSAGKHNVQLKCMGEGPPVNKTLTVEKDRVEPFFKQFPDHLCPES
jgi:serine/threonine protein kinase